MVIGEATKMNFAHIHLIINHIPLLTIPIAVIFLIYALSCNNNSLKQISLVILIATSASVIPVYLTGEPAEKAVKHLPGVTEDVIEPHEEAAEFSMIVTLIAGALAAASLAFELPMKGCCKRRSLCCATSKTCCPTTRTSRTR